MSCSGRGRAAGVGPWEAEGLLGGRGAGFWRGVSWVLGEEEAGPCRLWLGRKDLSSSSCCICCSLSGSGSGSGGALVAGAVALAVGGEGADGGGGPGVRLTTGGERADGGGGPGVRRGGGEGAGCDCVTLAEPVAAAAGALASCADAVLPLGDPCALSPGAGALVTLATLLPPLPPLLPVAYTGEPPPLPSDPPTLNPLPLLLTVARDLAPSCAAGSRSTSYATPAGPPLTAAEIATGA